MAQFENDPRVTDVNRQIHREFLVGLFIITVLTSVLFSSFLSVTAFTL